MILSDRTAFQQEAFPSSSLNWLYCPDNDYLSTCFIHGNITRTMLAIIDRLTIGFGLTQQGPIAGTRELPRAASLLPVKIQGQARLPGRQRPGCKEVRILFTGLIYT